MQSKNVMLIVLQHLHITLLMENQKSILKEFHIKHHLNICLYLEKEEAAIKNQIQKEVEKKVLELKTKEDAT